MRNRCVLVGLLALCGCSDLPEVIWRGELLDYAASPAASAKLCAGTPPRLDAAAVSIASRLEILDPERMTYYWVPEGLDATACDPRVSAGCATQGEAFAVAPFVPHEIVHVYARAHGRAAPFAEEGLAEYLGGTDSATSVGDPTMLYGHQRQLFDPSYYPAAGRFVAGVVALSSLPRFMAFYRDSDYDDDAESFEYKLNRHTDVDPAEVAALHRDEASCGSRAYREAPVACGHVPIPVEPTIRVGTRLEVLMECGMQTVWGVEGWLNVERTLEVGDRRQFSAILGPGTSALITPCKPGCAAGDTLTLEPIEDDPDDPDDPAGQKVELEPGRYALRLVRSEPGVASIEFVF